MSELDPTIFTQYAEHLLRRAEHVVARWTAVCGIVGALLGATLLTSWAHWPIHGQEARLVVLLGGVAGLVLGYSLGSRRAVGLQLQAQLAQHQYQFELLILARPNMQPDPVPESVPAQAPAPVQLPAAVLSSSAPPVSQ